MVEMAEVELPWAWPQNQPQRQSQCIPILSFQAQRRRTFKIKEIQRGTLKSLQLGAFWPGTSCDFAESTTISSFQFLTRAMQHLNERMSNRWEEGIWHSMPHVTQSTVHAELSTLLSSPGGFQGFLTSLTRKTNPPRPARASQPLNSPPCLCLCGSICRVQAWGCWSPWRCPHRSHGALSIAALAIACCPIRRRRGWWIAAHWRRATRAWS